MRGREGFPARRREEMHTVQQLDGTALDIPAVPGRDGRLPRRRELALGHVQIAATRRRLARPPRPLADSVLNRGSLRHGLTHLGPPLSLGGYVADAEILWDQTA